MDFYVWIQGPDNTIGLTIIYDRNGAMTINFLSAAPVGISKNFVICFCRPGNTIHSSSNIQVFLQRKEDSWFVLVRLI